MFFSLFPSSFFSFFLIPVFSLFSSLFFFFLLLKSSFSRYFRRHFYFSFLLTIFFSHHFLPHFSFLFFLIHVFLVIFVLLYIFLSSWLFFSSLSSFFFLFQISLPRHSFLLFSDFRFIIVNLQVFSYYFICFVSPLPPSLLRHPSPLYQALQW